MKPYKHLTRTIADLLATAIDMAVAELPHDLVITHRIAQKHAVDSWESVKQGYLGRQDCDPAILAILVDLVLLGHAAAELRSAMSSERPATAPDLRTARIRRVS